MAYPQINAGASNAVSSSVSLPLAYPTTNYAGKVTCAVVADRGNSTTPTPPTGWTLIKDFALSSPIFSKGYLFRKDTVTGSETDTDTETFTTSATNRKSGFMFASDADILEQISAGTFDVLVATIDHDSVTPTTTENLIMNVFFGATDGTLTPDASQFDPAGTDLQEASTSVTGGIYVGIGYTQHATATATTPGQSTYSGATTGNGLGQFTFVLSMASSATSPVISNVTSPNLNTTMTITVNSYDTVSDVTVNGVSCTSITEVNATTITAVVPLTVGAAPGTSVDVVVTDANGASTGYPVTLGLPSGYTSVTSTIAYAGLGDESPFNGEADFSLLTTGDILIYRTTSSGTTATPAGYTVSFDSNMNITVTGYTADPESITTDFWFLDQSDTYGTNPSTYTLTILSQDTLPDAFTITAKTGIEPSTANVESDPFTPTGYALDTPIPTSIEAGAEYAVSLDGGSSYGAFTSTTTNVEHVTGQPAPIFKVRTDASASYATTVSYDFTFGGVTATYSVTTRDAVSPAITFQPTDQNVTSGQTATFTLSATNAATYQWYQAPSTLLEGQTSSSLDIAATLSDDGNQYYCVVTSSESVPVTSATVTLTVFAASITVTSDVMRDAITKSIRASEVNIPVVIRDASRNVLITTTVSTNSSGIWSYTSNNLGDFGDTVYIEFYDSSSDTYTGFGYTLT